MFVSCFSCVNLLIFSEIRGFYLSADLAFGDVLKNRNDFMPGVIQKKCCSCTRLTFGVNLAIMLVDNTMCNRQSQSSPLTFFVSPRSKKWLKYLCEMLLGYSRPCV